MIERLIQDMYNNDEEGRASYKAAYRLIYGVDPK